MSLRDSRLFKPLLALSSSIFCVALADIGMGILFRDYLVLHRDERNLTYRYDPELGWFPISNSKKIFTGSRTIHVEQNERFTDKLRDKLAGWSVYNLGVSGYGTDQEYLLLKRQYDFYRPQIVFLVFCRDNDDEDNSRNVRYGVYYKPYFTVDGAGLSLRGVPVPKSENYFFSQHYLLAKSNWIRLFTRAYFILNAPADFVALRSPTQAIITDMQRFINSKGGRLIIGLQSSYAELETFLKDRGIPYVDLSNPYRYATQSRHWTPEGHAFVSDKIKEFLVNGHYLQSPTNKMPHSDLQIATRETRR